MEQALMNSEELAATAMYLFNSNKCICAPVPPISAAPKRDGQGIFTVADSVSDYTRSTR